MNKQITLIQTNFYPVPYEILEKLGLLAAIIWGIVWVKEHSKDTSITNEYLCGVTQNVRWNVRSALNGLIVNHYISDLRGGEDNVIQHEYRTTGRIKAELE